LATGRGPKLAQRCSPFTHEGYPSCREAPHRVLYCVQIGLAFDSAQYRGNRNYNDSVRDLPSPNKKHVRVLLVEENQEDAERIVNALRAADMQLTAERVDSENALVLALKRFKPDVVLTEHSLARLDFRTVLRLVSSLCPQAPVIVVAATITEASGSYVRAGAETFISKLCLPFIPPAIWNALEARSPLENLTSRQIEVMRLVADGHRTRDIADRLSLSVKTVESHRQQVMRRLGLRSMAALVRYSIRVGLAIMTPENGVAQMVRSSRGGFGRRESEDRKESA
jgi:DNA-binding NarL/FixJ family response regulator